VLYYGLGPWPRPYSFILGLLDDPKRSAWPRDLCHPFAGSTGAATDALGRECLRAPLAGSGCGVGQSGVLALIRHCVGVPLACERLPGVASPRYPGAAAWTRFTLPVLLAPVVLAFLLGPAFPMRAALCGVYIPQYFRVCRN